MVLTFRAREIRKQIMHARSAAQHRTFEPEGSAAQPSLYLAKQGDRYSLVSSGLPEASVRAYAVGIDAGAASDDDAGANVPDFVERMSLEAFTKALAKSEVAIVVTRTYINVLGGQPDRPRDLGATPPRGRPMRGRAVADVARRRP